MLLSWPAGADEVRVQTLAADFSLRLEDGRSLLLSDIEFPRALLNGKGAAEPAAQTAARTLLTELAVGKSLSVTVTGEPDRWRRLPVSAETADGRWLQGELLTRGLARFDPHGGDAALLDRLAAAEEPARQARLGLWADEAFAVKTPEQAGRWLDSLQLFEGTVVSVNQAKGFTYLNFSADWKTGLSARLPRGVAKLLPGDPLALAGRRLRLRGWLGKGRGPILEIRHPRQLQLLDGPWPAKMVPDLSKE